MYCTVVVYSLCLFFLLVCFLWNRWMALPWILENPVSPRLTILFMVCETFILILGWWNISVLVMGTMSRWVKGIHEKNRITIHDVKDLPHVLIIIPTYNESMDVLKRTLEHVMRVRYPSDKKTVVIGDDGKRRSMKILARRFQGCIYHTRQTIVGHAKAGNVNDILVATDRSGNRLYEGSLVLILDCDMAPEPDILENLVPLLYDSEGGNVQRNNRCAFIQSPQTFCNIRGLDFLGQHYRFFYNVVMPAYSGFQQGVPCCGTNVLFDREILGTIGNMQYGSVTEDFNTSMRLHSEGYISRYYTGRTAVGLAPMSLVDFFHQRQRWTIGGLQIVFTTPSYRQAFWKLPWIHRWIYGFSGASCITSVVMMFLLLTPFLDYFGISLFFSTMSTKTYVYSFVPYAVVYALSLVWLTYFMDVPTFLVTVFESIFMVPYQLYYTVHFFARYLLGFQHIRFRSWGRQNIRFTITPKTETKIEISKILHTVYLLSPFLVYIGLGLYCIITNRYDESRYFIDLLWMSFVMLQFSFPILYMLENSIPSFQWRSSPPPTDTEADAV